MTQPPGHIDDEMLSAFVDRQLSPAEIALVTAHLESCAACQERREGLRAVASLLRRLPELEPPRDFSLGPRLVIDPPNVVRLRRWYTATRVAAGSLAAAFVVLTAGTLYVDSRPAVSTAVVSSAPAEDATVRNAAPAPRAQSQSAPAGAGAAAPAPAAPAAARPAARPQPDDQIAAATRVSPLPTPVPARVPPVAALPPTPTPDPAAPLRTAAAAVGSLAALALLVTVVVRHRLRRQTLRS